MNTINEKELKKALDDDTTEVLVENNAQAIFDHLAVLEKQRELHEKRWFWELLQNAKDAVEENETVSVKVELDGNVLTFSHTGNPFFRKDILHVIYHGSSKKNKEGKTGRFGTGFMTTNLLAMQVNVTGKLTDGYYFQFELDREAADPKEEEQKLISSYQRFGDSLQLMPYTGDGYDTKFKFILGTKGLQTAADGLAQLARILPVVLAFNSKITEICVNNNGEEFYIKKTARKFDAGAPEGLQLQIREYSVNKDENLKVFVFDTGESQVALLVSDKTGKDKIVPLGKDYPRLFFDFPLFGTEEIGFPVIINSKNFDPRVERDGIYLGKEDKPEILTNKRVLKSALEHVIAITGYAGRNAYEDLYHLYAYQPSAAYPWLSNEWLNGVFTELVSKYMAAKVITLPQAPGRLLSLNELKVPLGAGPANDAFYGLVAELYADATPPAAEAGEWAGILENYQAIQQVPLETYACMINEEKLCQALDSEIKNLELLAPELHNRTPVAWLTDLYAVLGKEMFRTLIFKYKMIPNELGVFVKKDQLAPYIDEMDNDELKTIAALYGWKIREELIHPELTFTKDDFQVMTVTRVLRSLDSRISEITSEQLAKIPVRQAFAAQLKWLVDNRYEQEIRECQVFIADSSEPDPKAVFTKRKLFTAPSERLLAPACTWNDIFPAYSTLVKERLVLAGDYHEVLTPEDLQYLSVLGLLYLKPLNIIRKKATKTEIKQLIHDQSLMALLEEPNGDLKDLQIEFSDIPYLNTEEILSKTQSGVKSAKNLLTFILTEVLPNDPFAGKETRLTAGDKAVTLDQQLWISRLRNSRWVPVRNQETDVLETENAAAGNITPLLKGERNTLETLKQRNAALFFNKLGISVADILRNTIGSEEEKLLWDLTFSSLITNKVDPELAVGMLEDKGLQDEYLRKKKERETIADNQRTGYAFERMFREILESDSYKQKGIRIDRRARGSDFDIVADMDFLDENGKEIILQVGNLILELKATGKPYAEMTTTQAEDAVTYHKNYVLVILPLGGYDITEASIRAHARFVTNIGEILNDNFKDFTEYDLKKKIASVEKENVRLSIEEGKVRYQVKQNTWIPAAPDKTSLSFAGFEALLFSNEISSVEYK